jgi:Uncharacterized conserved protein
MQEVLSLDTPNWQLSIFCRNVKAKQNKLAATLLKRKKVLPETTIRFSPSVKILRLANDQEENNLVINEAYSEVTLPGPLFFENTQYSFEITFKNSAPELSAKISHKLQSINNSFYTRADRLVGTVDFSNHIGWFRLPFECHIGDKKYAEAISFEVLPTKMDLKSDLDKINNLIDETYPLWRFSLAEKTEQEYQRSRNNGPPFLLLWFAQFESLQDEFHRGFKQIINAPHNRLLSTEKSVKAHKLKGKLTAKLAQRVKLDFKNKDFDKRYLIKKKVLSLDTPENQFIKMVLLQAQSKLALFHKAALENEKAPDRQRLSDDFYETLNGWQQSLNKYAVNPLFKEISRFTGLKKESLVLQQKAGYSKVYSVWQQLKLYLDVLGDQSSISMKSVAELYEIWCFLEIRRILISCLNFEEVSNKKAVLTGNLLEKSTTDGLGASFKFKRNDGVSLRLAHEPTFNESGGPIRSWEVEHRPDIVLEATYQSGETLIWVFDAKYRIDVKFDTSNDDGLTHKVPNDAINQMHRYRDALIHITDKDINKKSRPVFGAFALYPGYFNQGDAGVSNHYDQMIEAINIGAFPLLPSENGEGSIWLEQFLKSKLGFQYKYPKNSASTDRYYIEEAARIPYYGMKQVRYDDLTLLATSAQNDRNTGYYKSFENGTARWFHMQLKASDRENMTKNAIYEVKYCIVAAAEVGQVRKANYIWPVISVVLKPRIELTTEQTGLPPKIGADSDYWLFELGEPRKLSHQVSAPNNEHHHIRLVEANKIEDQSSFSEFDTVEVYRGV